MITKNIKYPYAKFILDCIGVLASIGILVMLCVSAYVAFNANGNSEFGINIAGQNFVIFNILVAVVLLSALSSYILKKIK